jgi:formate/nitrite transporter
MLGAAEAAAKYAQQYGVRKATLPFWKLFLLGILGGLLIAFASAASSTAAFSLGNVSLIRLVSGLLFPFGLAVVILSGAELFTGSSLIILSVLDRKATLAGMFRNWAAVYTGNFAGALLLAAGCAFFGQFDHAAGALAVFTIKVAAAKCALPFASAVILGIFCNVLVCLGVFCSLCADDVSGRILGAYVPVALFVICGFEHSVANMYYISAGLFAEQIPAYAAKAAIAGIDAGALNWGRFLAGNLLPVTLGNIIGGVAVGAWLWFGFLQNKAAKSE